MSELQAAEGTIAPDENLEQEVQEVEQSQDETSDLAPDTADKPEEKITFSEEQQAIFNEEIGKKTYKLRQTEREKEELAQQLEELKSKLPKESRPQVPPMPQPFDDDFEAKVRQRDEAILAQARFDAAEKIRAEQEQARQKEQEEQRQKDTYSKQVAYFENAKKLGIEPNELAEMGGRVGSFLPQDLQMYIMEEEKGGLITKYLASNVLEIEKLSQMSPLRAAEYIATSIKPKVEQLTTKKVSQAPDPVETLSGRGANTERGPSGATFE